MPGTSNAYPVNLTIDYPDRNLNRLTTFFRIFTVIPIAIIIGLLTSAESAVAGLVFLLLVLMILFRQSIQSGGLTGMWR